MEVIKQDILEIIQTLNNDQGKASAIIIRCIFRGGDEPNCNKYVNHPLYRKHTNYTLETLNDIINQLIDEDYIISSSGMFDKNMYYSLSLTGQKLLVDKSNFLSSSYFQTPSADLNEYNDLIPDEEDYAEEQNNLDSIISNITIEIKSKEQGKYTDVDNTTIAIDYERIDEIRDKQRYNNTQDEKIRELKKMIVSPYENRLDLSPSQTKSIEAQSYYIGLTKFDLNNKILIHDWRGIYGKLHRSKDTKLFVEGKTLYLLLRRNLEINNSKVTLIRDEYDARNGSYTQDEGIVDPFLYRVLLRKKNIPNFTNIISTIQKKQNEIINLPLKQSFILQGCAGSGKTMILFHRLSQLKYDNKELNLEKITVISPSNLYNMYVGNLAKELDLHKLNILSIQEYYENKIALYKVFDRTRDFKDESLLSDLFINQIYQNSFFNSQLTIIWKYIGSHINDAENKVLEKLRSGRDSINALKKKLSELSTEVYKPIYEYCVINKIDVSTLDTNIDYIKLVHNAHDKLKLIITKYEESKKILENANKSIYDAKIKKAWLEDEYFDVINWIQSQKDDDIQTLHNLNNGLAKMNITNAAIELGEKIKFNNLLFSRYKKASGLIDSSYESAMLIKSRIESYIMSDLDISSYYKHNKYLTDLIGKHKEDYYNLIASINAEESTVQEIENKTIPSTKQLFLEIRNHLVDSDSSELVKEGLNTLAKIEREYDIPTSLDLRDIFNKTIHSELKKLKEKSGLKTRSFEGYKFLSYLKLRFLNYIMGSIDFDNFICIDEGQDLSIAEYVLLKDLNDENTIFNIYGDLDQVISSHGIRKWNHIDLRLSHFELSENYRNTTSIIEYCNKKCSMGMTNLGIDGSLVEHISFDNIVELLNSIKDKSVGIIYNDDVIWRRIYDKIQKKEFRLGENARLLNVHEVKGLEFNSAIVFDTNMMRNEKYIAYTRALEKLYIVT